MKQISEDNIKTAVINQGSYNIISDIAKLDDCHCSELKKENEEQALEIAELEKGLNKKIRIMLSNSNLQLSIGYLTPILNNQLKRTDINERVDKVLKIMKQAIEEQED